MFINVKQRILIRKLLADQPFIGPVIRRVLPAPPIRFGVEHVYMIRHERFAWYYRDPYGYKKMSNDTLKEWGSLRQGFKFTTLRAAESCVMWQGLSGTIEKHRLP